VEKGASDSPATVLRVDGEPEDREEPVPKAVLHGANQPAFMVATSRRIS
jgi:hypothetical protein